MELSWIGQAGLGGELHLRADLLAANQGWAMTRPAMEDRLGEFMSCFGCARASMFDEVVCVCDVCVLVVAVRLTSQPLWHPWSTVTSIMFACEEKEECLFFAEFLQSSSGVEAFGPRCQIVSRCTYLLIAFKAPGQCERFLSVLSGNFFSAFVVFALLETGVLISCFTLVECEPRACMFLFANTPKSVFMCVLVFSPSCPSIFGASYVELHYFFLCSSLCLYPRFFYPSASFPLMISSLWFGVAISMAVSFSLILSPCDTHWFDSVSLKSFTKL
jgi:hypothetical protein